ncbi:nuclear transport factor 2 family protein [Actinomadura coerulea]|uniref:nuclear transport factor 2 family protein n=1 Tax=Actinomadura coerulea TaxID=46159 RepID=UPI00343AA36F
MTDWVRDYYDHVDGLDAAGVAKHFAQDGTFRLGNSALVRGPADIAAGNQAFFDTIAGMRHDFTSRYTDGRVDIVEAEVTYTLKNGGTVTIPGIAALERNEENLIAASRSYIDMGPLSESAARATGAESPHEWIERFISAVDTLDLDRILPFFAESATFTYGNNPPMVGVEGIHGGLQPFHDSIAGISHIVRNCFPSGPNVIVGEFVVTYTRLDGRSVTLPAVGVYELADGLIQTYRVYADVAPVFAPAT